LRGRFARARPRGPRLFALAFHGGIESRKIDPDATGFQGVLGEIERKPIGVVERERHLTLEVFAWLEIAAFIVEDRQPALQRPAEAGFLELEGLGDQGLRTN